MKELTIEQKAKAYDEAIEKAKEEYDKANGITKESLKKVFPQELKYADDEGIRKHLISLFEKFVTLGVAHECESADIKVDDILAWLEKQGELMSVGWSKEDEKIYQSIMDDTVQENQLDSKQIDWLRNIKYRYFQQPKSEWSEYNENIIVKIKTKIAQCNGFNKKNREEVFGLIDSLRPQKQWKPSNKQVYSLDRVLSFYGKGTAVYDSVKELLEQLKKLREE